MSFRLVLQWSATLTTSATKTTKMDSSMRQLEQNLVPAAATSITKLVRTLENNHVKKILVKTILNKSIVNVHLKKKII